MLEQVDIDKDIDNAIGAVVKSAKAYLDEDKIIQSKTASPFHFMHSGVAKIKEQANVDTAVRIAKLAMPHTLFYCIDDAVSNNCIENNHLKDGPVDVTNYLCFATNGVVGDVKTNVHAWHGIGKCLQNEEFPLVGDGVPKWSAVNLDFGEDDDLVGAMVEGIPIILDDIMSFGDLDVKMIIPANFSRVASVKDLEVNVNMVQVINDTAVAGFCKKSAHIFKSWRFYLIEPISGLCLAVPVAYVRLYDLLSLADRNPVDGFSSGIGPLTFSTVLRYQQAINELRAYSFPWLWKLYLEPLNWLLVVEGLNKTIEKMMVKPINGVSFKHIVLLWGTIQDYRPYCKLLIGSDKSTDVRVAGYMGNMILKVPNINKIDDSATMSVVKAFAFTRKKKSEVSVQSVDSGIGGQVRIGDESGIKGDSGGETTSPPLSSGEQFLRDMLD